MMNRKTWKEFQNTGLLWWTNRMLHLFGWAVVFVVEETGEISDVYPARCTFRGFNQLAEDEGFQKLTAYMAETVPELKRETTGEELCKLKS